MIHKEHTSNDAELDHLLGAASEAHHREALPADLFNRVESKLKARRRRHHALITGLSAAAVYLFAVGWGALQLIGNKTSQPPSGQVALEVPSVPPAISVMIQTPGDVIIKHVPTNNPNITLHWLYPVIKVADIEPSSQATPASTHERSM
jgi:hypothetical protein